MGSFVNCRRRLSVSRQRAVLGLHTPVPGMSSKAVMPPDNTAQIFEKGMKEKPAPVTFPHRIGAHNILARAFPFACGMQDLTPPGEPAAQRVPSGRIATSEIPRSKLRDISLSRQSPNIRASTAAWLVARGNKAAGAERGDKNAGKH